ncbi:MAG: peptidyl-alpha-hydroxyglycine alpha-amidating lyase family protein [Planctomycetota bacterium]|nr:peptidyl-alpha-hydroxyglycine alpha-amidating lyase family protein [Planctomycetota bacterium]
MKPRIGTYLEPLCRATVMITGRTGIAIDWRLRTALLSPLLIFLAGALAAQTKKPPPGVDYPRVSLSLGYQLDATWPRQRSGYAWEAMAGIAVDPAGLIWTLNRGEMPVQVYNTDGKLVRQWGAGMFQSPHQLSIGPRGHIWIADSHDHVVYQFAPDGTRLRTLGIPGEFGDDERHFKMPTDVVETKAGDVFISDGYRNNRVVHYNGQGKFVKQWGTLGVAPGEFSLPHSIDVDSQGRLYVADRNNARVQIFDQAGKFLAQWQNLMVPWTVRVTDRDEVYVCGASPSRWRKEDIQLGIPPKDQLVMKLDTSGRILSWWQFPLGQWGADKQARPGTLAWVHGLGIDSKGNLYLGDIMGKRVQRFDRVAPLGR